MTHVNITEGTYDFMCVIDDVRLDIDTVSLMKINVNYIMGYVDT